MIPRSPAFLDQYRADAFVEDFLALTTEDAAALALDLWDFNRQNEANASRAIRTRRAIGAGGRPLRLDVAEIVGPDIAFLVDSAIDACQEAKVEIRAVLHPVVDGPERQALDHPDPPARCSTTTCAPICRSASKTPSPTSPSSTPTSTPCARRWRAVSAELAGVKATGGRTSGEINEARAFLAWLADENFTYLGARDYTFAMDKDGRLANEEPVVDEASGLGILRDPARNVLSRGAEPTMLTPTIRAFINEPSPIIVAKASFVSPRPPPQPCRLCRRETL